MSAQQPSSVSCTNVPSFDDLFEIPTTLRIPPLQTPLPASLSTSQRPSPLEPDARLNMATQATRLTSRQIALASAEMLEAPKPGELEALTQSRISDSDPPAAPRPRTKLFDHEQITDFVHLPKPQAKREEPKKLRFRPIAALNKLHEPPPSAALFPPITPNASQEEHEQSITDKPSAKGLNPHQSTMGTARKAVTKASDSERPKRTYTRGRTKWTEAETEQLVKGVAIYGMGRWKDILEHRDFIFQSGRTCVDLKDKFRTLFPPNAPHRWARKLPQREDYEESLDADRHGHDPRFPQRARRRAWGEREDLELEKGFRLYGFQWHLIAKDETLHFNNRTSSQIRDRFRLRFAELYRQAAPIVSAKTSAPRDCRVTSKEKRKRSSIQEATLNERQKRSPDLEIHDSQDGEQSKVSTRTGAPDYLYGLLNDDNEEGKMSGALSQYDWDDDLTLAPLQWEDMVPPPMFDLG